MVHLGMSTQQSLALSSVTRHRSLCSLLPAGKMRLLQPRQRAALACGHKHQDSEGSLVHVHSSSQQHVPHPWACDLPRLSTGTGHVFPPTQQCLALIRMALDTLESVLLLMKQAIPCLSGWYPSMWSQPLSKTINDFLPQLRAQHFPDIKASQWGRSSQLGSHLISMCLMSKMCDLFSNRVQISVCLTRAKILE